jgi:hypothetical protein
MNLFKIKIILITFIIIKTYLLIYLICEYINWQSLSDIIQFTARMTMIM